MVRSKLHLFDVLKCKFYRNVASASPLLTFYPFSPFCTFIIFYFHIHPSIQLPPFLYATISIQCYTHRPNREFDVPSLNFPGQVHKWQLSQFLQKGRLRAQTSLLNDLALAARFIIVTAKARISGHFFSVAHAANALLKGLLRLVDMVIGIPSLLAHNLEYKIKEERCRYLVAELVCRVR